MLSIKFYKVLNQETKEYRRVKGWRTEEPIVYRKTNTDTGVVLEERPSVHVNEWIPPDGEEITEEEYNKLSDHPYNKVIEEKIRIKQNGKQESVATDRLEHTTKAVVEKFDVNKRKVK